MDALDPALFIGSSTEGLAIARELQAEVDQQCEPTVWSQDVFVPGGMTLSELLIAAQNTDFAALVLTPDDSVVSRGEQRAAVRDNVIFELGLFLGALGPRRVFIIRPRDQDLQLPSDLAGMTVLDGCGSFEVSWLRCEGVGFAVFRVVDAFVFSAEVVTPVGVEVAAGGEGTELEDGFGSFQAPSRAGDVHSVLDDVAAGSFDGVFILHLHVRSFQFVWGCGI
jgi:hypothetical protein